jgi:hypothetical protein
MKSMVEKASLESKLLPIVILRNEAKRNDEESPQEG